MRSDDEPGFILIPMDSANLLMIKAFAQLLILDENEF